jgi:hypothetical protein
MSSPAPTYEFFTELARIINSGQSRTVILSGNVHDLFFVPGATGDGTYVPLIEFLTQKAGVKGVMLLVYELNGPIRTIQPAQRDVLKNAWIAWKSGSDYDQFVLASVADRKKRAEREALDMEFDRLMLDAVGKPTVAFELLRQLAVCSRSKSPTGRRFLAENLLIVVEAADLVLPAGSGDVAALNPADRQRVMIAQDWFSDPGFMNGDDSIVLLAEARGLIHPRVAGLPCVLNVAVPSPDVAARRHFIEWYLNRGLQGRPAPKLWAGEEELARFTAGLSLHALRQLLVGASHTGRELAAADVVQKVEAFIASQLGEDVIEFKKPAHSLDDVVGFSKLKAFLKDELIPRFRSSGSDALSGAAVAGPIGGGKTFIFEAVASSLDMPVLVLKNIRSQWFGQTDVIFERLRRVLEALVKAVIFVDEADTQFGGVGAGAHETERRLTGKIQQMMSDPKLRGRIIWLLMTARIHLLSPDIRRPGRVGDLIIPVLDPEGPDRREFLRWTLKGTLSADPDDAALDQLDALTRSYSAAAFTSLRSQLKARAATGPISIDQAVEVVRDHLSPAIELTRRYQTLQALVNCTRRSLLPDPAVTDEVRQAWQLEIRKLEAVGIQ